MFPDGFVWGVSTSAYQIEGATREGGRGVSVWDTFCATPDKIRNGDNADIACDHYNRFPEDIALMSELGVHAYRFSVAWPRIQPNGQGPANPEGLDFYDRLVDALCEAGISPVTTLYHWDTPQALEDAGGWLVKDTAERFAEYAAIVGERLADRVNMWIPLNEPMVETLFGYALGEYAPGKALLFDAMPAAHYQNLAHGFAVSALRSVGAKAVGTANNHSPVWPATRSEQDLQAAAALSAVINWMYSDPMVKGSYPDEVIPYLPAGFADDLAKIAAPLDFYGVNYYEPQGVAAPGEGNPMPFELRPVDGYPLTTNDSPVVPDGLREFLTTLKARYGEQLPPVYITESGCSFDGIQDQQRIDYHTEHLAALAKAMSEGVDVRGYFVWSLLDNFEWSKGYQPRFGLVHIDYETLARTPKDSFHWYRKLIGGVA
ncbi:beta-glucosidase [Kibdelosporangium banguiense]|uniref:Beta-glucosidase n=1 Tax=Kibdelosporangium banguiense TaxID=1365924 RepID=A0ABS4TBK2_9PSEU|nr:GH1 family beta-glucosidase [Kibdelosporangium banguiense]MBP2321802.1 beta-glucosidase [Kibdelosporangium banguiense]